MDDAAVAAVAADPPSTIAFAWIELAVYAVAFPLNVSSFFDNLPAIPVLTKFQQLLLLVAYVKHRRDLLVRTVDCLFLLIIIVHIVWTIVFSWVQGYVNITLGGFDASTSSNIRCQAIGILLLETAGNAIATHVLIAVERWMTVVRGVRDTRPTLLAILASSEILFAVILVIQTHSTRPFEPEQSGLYCFFPFVAKGKDIASLAGTIMAGCFCLVSAGIVMGTYAYIYVVVIRTSRRAADNNEKTLACDSSGEHGSPQAGRTARWGASEHDRRIFYRCVGVVGVYTTCYFLEFANFGYQLIANTRVADWVDGLAATLTAVDTLASPIMIVFMNKKLARAAASVVGLQIPEWWMTPGGRRGHVHPVGDTKELTSGYASGRNDDL
ncbi:hypothetical protein HK101_002593 [Irineochytrium annulatum]|nr:hypothetical protein HK101_002593 [Irineochytrium annulatum]